MHAMVANGSWLGGHLMRVPCALGSLLPSSLPSIRFGVVRLHFVSWGDTL